MCDHLRSGPEAVESGCDAVSPGRLGDCFVGHSSGPGEVAVGRKALGLPVGHSGGMAVDVEVGIVEVVEIGEMSYKKAVEYFRNSDAVDIDVDIAVGFDSSLRAHRRFPDNTLQMPSKMNIHIKSTQTDEAV